MTINTTQNKFVMFHFTLQNPISFLLRLVSVYAYCWPTIEKDAFLKINTYNKLEFTFFSCKYALKIMTICTNF